MATVTTGVISADAISQNTCHQTAGLLAGETLALGAAVYIKSDGKVWNATGAAANAAAVVKGVVMAKAVANQPVTIYGNGLRFSYAPSGGLTPGAFYFLSGTVPGAIDTAASTGDATGVFHAVTDMDLEVVRAL